MTLVQGMRPVLLRIAPGAAGASWLVVTAALACYVPGRRAMRIDPAEALRLE